MSKRTRAELVLILASFIWGLTFPFIRIVVAEINPVVLNFWRGGIAALIFAPFVLCFKNQRQQFFKLLPAGMLLGLFFYIGYLTQSIGLETLHSGRSAFITNLSVVLVPLLSPLFKSGYPTKNDIISSCIACVGLILLTDPFSDAGISVGDFWTVMTALAFSIQIHLVQIYMKRYKNYGMISFMQVLFIFIFSALCLPSALQNGAIKMFPTSTAAIGSLLFLAIVATVTIIWIQARYQYETTPERAAVIFVLEPVFAAILGFLILHESMSLLSLIGATLMVCSVLWGFIARLKNITYLFKFK